MKKRILIISQHFWPENFRISDIATGFVENDIEVDVICGIPNYPNGIVPEGYGWFKNKKQDFNGATVYRTWEIVRKGNSNIRIFLNYISYPFFAAFKVLGFLGKKYDAVFCYETSPVYMIFPAIVYSKLKRVPLTTYVLDLWPENLYSVLKIQNKFLRALVQSTSHWHYRRCDKLIAMSPSLNDTLVRITGKDKSCVATIPQYCEKFYEQDIHNPELEEKYKGVFRIVYAGNISPAQNVEVAVDAAVMLKKDGIKDIKFIIVGDGMSKKDIENYVKEKDVCEYFDFLGSKPVTDMPVYHTLADALFAPLAKSDDLGLTIPAKVTSYMAGGKPVLTCIDGEGSYVIEKAQAGLTAPSGDSLALYRNIVKLYSMSQEERDTMGANARRYHFENHSRDKVLGQLIDFILD
ncbi:MAG: glycosyltransferase family 4 protein [Oscillospiraceae bacterium]|nr:glycosyltransferase family 4 protein [Oscillospiraceae bacterium]